MVISLDTSPGGLECYFGSQLVSIPVGHTCIRETIILAGTEKLWFVLFCLIKYVAASLLKDSLVVSVGFCLVSVYLSRHILSNDI